MARCGLRPLYCASPNLRTRPRNEQHNNDIILAVHLVVTANMTRDHHGSLTVASCEQTGLRHERVLKKLNMLLCNSLVICFI